MWTLTDPWYNPVLKGFVIYFSIFILVRVMGKKQLAKFSSFDLILLIIISETIQNAISGENRILAGALFTVSVIFGLHIIIKRFIGLFPSLEKLVDGQPVVVILNGKVFKKILKEQRITEAELFEALREHEVLNAEDVKCAILEKDGNLSVIKYAF